MLEFIAEGCFSFRKLLQERVGMAGFNNLVASEHLNQTCERKDRQDHLGPIFRRLRATLQKVRVPIQQRNLIANPSEERLGLNPVSQV